MCENRYSPWPVTPNRAENPGWCRARKEQACHRRPQVGTRRTIKAALRKQYGTLRRLSQTWGLHPSAIANTLGDPAYSVPTEKRIALLLGKRPQELWPDRWDAAGKSLPRPNRHKPKSKSVAIDSQKTRAA